MQQQKKKRTKEEEFNQERKESVFVDFSSSAVSAVSENEVKQKDNDHYDEDDQKK